MLNVIKLIQSNIINDLVLEAAQSSLNTGKVTEVDIKSEAILFRYDRLSREEIILLNKTLENQTCKQ